MLLRLIKKDNPHLFSWCENFIQLGFIDDLEDRLWSLIPSNSKFCINILPSFLDETIEMSISDQLEWGRRSDKFSIAPTSLVPQTSLPDYLIKRIFERVLRLVDKFSTQITLFAFDPCFGVHAQTILKMNQLLAKKNQKIYYYSHPLYLPHFIRETNDASKVRNYLSKTGVPFMFIKEKEYQEAALSVGIHLFGKEMKLSEVYVEKTLVEELSPHIQRFQSTNLELARIAIVPAPLLTSFNGSQIVYEAKLKDNEEEEQEQLKAIDRNKACWGYLLSDDLRVGTDGIFYVSDLKSLHNVISTLTLDQDVEVKSLQFQEENQLELSHEFTISSLEERIGFEDFTKLIVGEPSNLRKQVKLVSNKHI